MRLICRPTGLTDGKPGLIRRKDSRMGQAETPEAGAGLRALIEEIGHQLPLLDAKRAGAELYGAPRLSPYELFRPNENALSRVIGDLLDPRGTHGQGSLFLNALLDALGLPSVSLRHRNNVRVRYEVLTSRLPTGKERRRIDLVVETPTVLLGIENKPWVKQSQDQLRDYSHQLELDARAKGLRPVLVFLSGQEEESAPGKVRRMRYHTADQEPSLHRVLSSTIESVRAARARAHVEDFVRYIETKFGGGTMNEEGYDPHIQAVQAEFAGGAIRKKALAAVLMAQSNLHASILGEIAEFLLKEIQEEVSKDFVSSNKQKLYGCLKVREPWTISRPSWPANCFVCLESQQGTFVNVYFGVKAPDPESDKVRGDLGSVCRERRKLEDLGTKVSGGSKTPWWPWYQGMGHWGPEFAARLVIDSPEGDVSRHREIQELARQIVQLAKAVEDSLNA